MMLATLVVSTVLLQAPALPLTASPRRPLGTLREQAAVQQDWLRYRLDSVLPRLMRQYKVAMWVVPMRERSEERRVGKECRYWSARGACKEERYWKRTSGDAP